MNHQVSSHVLKTVIALVCAGWVRFGATGANAPADNWPQWRGPLQNGVAPSADPPTSWSETENVRWKTKIPGEGSSTPLVWDNLIFVQTAIPTGKKIEAVPAAASEPEGRRPADATGEPPPKGPDGGPGPGKGPDGRPGEPGRGPGGGRRGGPGGGIKPTEVHQFVILCLDRSTGKVLWQQTAREEVPHEGVRQNDGTFASTSGLTDGKHVWAYFGSRGLYCYDLQGKLTWSQDLGKMRVAMGFGEGSSPVLCRDALIVNWDNEAGSFITALDKNSGKQLWKEARDEGTSWSTPLALERDGKAQVVVAATRKIRSYDPETGKVLWECSGLTRNVIPCPVADEDRVYCMSGFQGNSLLAIKLGAAGDLTGTDSVVWSLKKSTPYVPSPLLYNGKLYFYANNNAIISCVEAKTGQVLTDAERLEGIQGVYASPVGAGGRIYLAGRNGVTVVLKQSDKVEVLATSKLDDKFDASPAAVGKDLFLRGRENLYCLSAK